jgi:alanyl-tRNA synthetase
MSELPGMVTKLLDERKTARRENAQLSARLAQLEAQALLAKGERTIVHAFDRADAAFLRQVAAALTSAPAVRAVLASRSARQFVFARAEEASGDMKRLLGETIAIAGGKGGGSKDFAQGTVPESANIDEILARALNLLNSKTG